MVASCDINETIIHIFTVAIESILICPWNYTYLFCSVGRQLPAEGEGMFGRVCDENQPPHNGKQWKATKRDTVVRQLGWLLLYSYASMYGNVLFLEHKISRQINVYDFCFGNILKWFQCKQVDA